MGISGHATPESTRAFRARAFDMGIHREHFREVGGINLTSVGMGTYLGEPDQETDLAVERAVVRSLTSGAINIIDTAINYRFQKAERSVGRALSKLMEAGDVRREEVFVSTKNGYITHDADLQLDFYTYLHRHLIKSGIISANDISSAFHCMKPAFLKDQLSRSLSNLGLETIDLIYLHNAPESQIPEVGLEGFMEMLEEAFHFYEEQRREGRTKFYGLATWNSLITDHRERQHFQLEKAVAVAEKVGGKSHGFKFIQLPLNLAVGEAFTRETQLVGGKPMTSLDAARALNLKAFTSAPLLHGRLASHPSLPSLTSTGSRVHYLLQFPRSAHPSIVAPLVGHKDPRHVEENIALSKLPPLAQEEVLKVYSPFLKENPEDQIE